MSLLDEDELDEAQLRRLGVEWMTAVAMRELLDIALRKEQGATYRQAINFGAENAPSVLGMEKRLLRGLRESQDARLYDQLATAESARTGQFISRLDYVNREIDRLRSGIDDSQIELSLAEGKLEVLMRIRAEITPKKYTESQLIIRDAIKVERNLPISKDGDSYKEYEIDEERRLRVRVLHPDPPEHKIGADLVYEFHDTENDSVRVCLLQYKLWNGKSLSRDSRMDGQFARLRAIGCSGSFCKPKANAGTRPPFRFPNCSVFLRPTDRLQNRDATLITSGLHIPLCIADESWSENNRLGQSIYKTTVQDQSIDHGLFEDLFYKNFLGSGWMPSDELEDVYIKYGVLDSEESLLIHSQEYAIKGKGQPKRRKRKPR